MMTLKGLGGYYKNIPKIKFCTLCKKNRMACTFYWHGKKHMCMYCHQQFIQGKKLVEGKWIGYRFSATKGYQKAMRRKIQAKKLSTFSYI